MSDTTIDGTKVTVTPHQDIVASMAKDFKGELKAVLDGEVSQLTIDLGQVRMIDSSGLGVLIAAHNSLQKKGASLALIHVSADIIKLLRHMRLDKHFAVSGD